MCIRTRLIIFTCNPIVLKYLAFTFIIMIQSFNYQKRYSEMHRSLSLYIIEEIRYGILLETQ